MPRPAPFFFNWGDIAIPKSTDAQVDKANPIVNDPKAGAGQTPQAGQGTPPQYTAENPRFGAQSRGGRWQGPQQREGWDQHRTPFNPREGQIPQQPGPDYGFAKPPPPEFRGSIPFNPQQTNGPVSPGGGIGANGMKQSAMKNAGGGGAAGWLGILAALSDRRLKKNIQKIGKLVNGLNVYTFDYIWGESSVGVMSDEVRQVRPDAVTTFHGFDVVDYSEIL